VDGNKEWGKVGDDMIGILEHAYLENMGKEGQQQIELGRQLLRHNQQVQAPPALPEVKLSALRVQAVKAPPKVKFETPSYIEELKRRAAKGLRPGARPAKAKAKAKRKAR
jgi:hypothetical protein